MSGAALVAVQFVPGVGEVVDGALLVGAAGLGLYVLYKAVTSQSVGHADTQADTQLKQGDQATPCIDCGEMPCFEPPEGGDRDEMARQLKDQQDLINSQTPDQMQQRLDAAQARKDATGSYRPPGDAADRASTRSSYQSDQTSARAQELEAGGMGPEQAQSQASSEVSSQMKGLDATHELDSIAGGSESDVMGMGDKSTNRSIGSQWKSRRGDLEQAVKSAKEKGQEKMDVKLEVCDE